MDRRYIRNNLHSDLNDLHSDLPFLPKRMKIDKCKKFVFNLLNKKIRCAYKIIKTALNHGLKFKKFTELLNLIKKHGLNHILI